MGGNRIGGGERESGGRGEGSGAPPSTPTSTALLVASGRAQLEEDEKMWYKSPEELQGGKETAASDIYKVGVLFFEVGSWGPLSGLLSVWLGRWRVGG